MPPPPEDQPAPPDVPPAAQAEFVEPPHSRSLPELLPPGAGTGRPPGFEPDAPAAYWIWQGPQGDWRVRTTTARSLHVFRGRLHGTTGSVVNVHPTRTEFRDRVRRARDGWVFDFRSAGHADGFTFATDDNGCLRFDLQLGGGPEPKRIFVGHDEVQPKSGHFIVCPKGKAP